MPARRDDASRSAQMSRLVHQLRQPLSALRLLVERARELEEGDDLGAILEKMEGQIDEAIQIARALSRESD